MDRPQEAVWNERRMMEDGVVSVRNLSHHTTQVLKAVEESGVPVLVTRQNKVVAYLAPTTWRQVLNHGIGEETRMAMKTTEKELDQVITEPASSLIRD